MVCGGNCKCGGNCRCGKATESFSADNDEEDRKHYQFKDDGEIEYLVFGKGRAAKRKTHLMVFSKAYGDKPFSMYDKFRGTPNGMACGVTNRAGIHTFQWDETLTPDAVNCIPCSKYVQSLRDKNWLFTEEKTAESFSAECDDKVADVLNYLDDSEEDLLHGGFDAFRETIERKLESENFSVEMMECGNCDETFTIDEGLDIGGIDYCEECYDTISAKNLPFGAESFSADEEEIFRHKQQIIAKMMRDAPACESCGNLKTYTPTEYNRYTCWSCKDDPSWGAEHNQTRFYRNLGVGAALVAGLAYWFKR